MSPQGRRKAFARATQLVIKFELKGKDRSCQLLGLFVFVCLRAKVENFGKLRRVGAYKLTAVSRNRKADGKMTFGAYVPIGCRETVERVALN